MNALVFDIQRSSLQDGPGIRTTVFLKGCCMRCGWCHNPESFDLQPRTAVLPNGTGKTWGREMPVEEVFDIVKRDKPFYDSSAGGVTVSGGEPALFPAFVAGLFRLCRRAGIRTAVETNGFTDWKNFEEFLSDTDLFLFDYKMTDPEAHRRWTGTDREPVIRNLERIVNAGKQVILRCPVVPAVNDDDGHLKGIAELVLKHGLTCQVMPYHGTASDKWKALGLKNVLEGKPSMTEKEARDILNRLADFGIPPDRISLP